MKKRSLILITFAMAALLSFACNMPGKVQSTPADLINMLTSTALAGTAEPSPTATQPTVTGVPTITMVVPVAPVYTPQPPPFQPATARPPANTPTIYVPPAPTATVTPIPIPCNMAQFDADLTVPDGSTFKTAETFTKVWRIKNIGSCNWTADYRVVLESGIAMGAPTAIALPAVVAPGQSVDISIPMTAPGIEGTFQGNWKLRSGSNETFSFANKEPFYVQIRTIFPQRLVYNFAGNYCLANWESNAGKLPCPGKDDDNRGFVVKLDNPVMEDYAHTNSVSIYTHPLWNDNDAWNEEEHKGGWIEGVYPPVTVQSGQRFMAGIGCLEGSATCDVNFMLDYRVAGEAWKTLTPEGAWHEVNDETVRRLEVDLTPLAGKVVEFKLKVDAAGNAGQDWAVWVFPRIESR